MVLCLDVPVRQGKSVYYVYLDKMEVARRPPTSRGCVKQSHASDMSNQVFGWRRLSKRRDKSAYVSCINHASRCCSATVDRKEGMSSLPVIRRTSSPEWCCASMCLFVKARAFIRLARKQARDRNGECL